MDDYEHLAKPLPIHPSGVQILAGLGLNARSDFRPLFDAGQEVVTLVHECKPPGVEGKDALLWSSMYRSMKTFRAVLILCDSGFGEQAGMLCRSLFDDMLVTHWMRRTDAEELRRRFRDHADRVKLVEREVLVEHGYLPDIPEVPTFDHARMAELLETGGTKGAFRVWHGQKTRQLLQDLAEEFDGPDARLLDEMHDLAYRLQNLVVHHSPQALEFTIGVSVPSSALLPAGRAKIPAGQQRVPFVTSKPGLGYVEEALRSGYFSVSRQALAVLDRGGIDRLRPVLQKTRRLLIDLSPADLRLGRNEACPCGSGLKLKNCHGR